MYSVGISNIFELLGEEGQEGKNVNLARAKTVESTPQASTKQTTVTAPAQKDQQKRSDAKGEKSQGGERGRGRGRGGRGGARGGRGGDRPPRFDSAGAGSSLGHQRERTNRTEYKDKEDKGSRDEKLKERRDLERTDEGRGGKRNFERRSGTGRGKELKKGGAGKGGWGDNRAPALTDETPTEQQEEDEGKESSQTPEGKTEEPAPPKELTEEEKKQLEEEEAERKFEESRLTLDDFRKKKEEERKKLGTLSLPAPRKAGEGVDNKEWATYTPLARENEEKLLIKKEEKKEKEAKKGAVPVESVLDIKTPPIGKKPRERGDDFKPRGGNRGGRGGNRGGRGGNRGGKGRGAPPPGNDQANFPVLSTKA